MSASTATLSTGGAGGGVGGGGRRGRGSSTPNGPGGNDSSLTSDNFNSTPSRPPSSSTPTPTPSSTTSSSSGLRTSGGATGGGAGGADSFATSTPTGRPHKGYAETLRHGNRRAIRMPHDANMFVMSDSAGDLAVGSRTYAPPPSLGSSAPPPSSSIPSSSQQKPEWAAADTSGFRRKNSRTNNDSKVLAMVQNINNATGNSPSSSSSSQTPPMPPNPQRTSSGGTLRNSYGKEASGGGGGGGSTPRNSLTGSGGSSGGSPAAPTTPTGNNSLAPPPFQKRTSSTPVPPTFVITSSHATTSSHPPPSDAPSAQPPPPSSAPTQAPTNTLAPTPTPTPATTAQESTAAENTSTQQAPTGPRKFFTLRRGGGGGGGQQAQRELSDISLEYENYLAVARKEKFDDIIPFNFLYQSGKDALGRPIIVMVGAQLPAKKVDLERVMLYAISVMDHVVESEYVMVYAHTNMSSENRPNFAWLRKMYSIFNRKYKKNLKQLYIVHPTVWVKMTFRLFKPFLSAKFWRKLVYVDQSADLWNYFQRDQITLPNYVLNYGAPPKKAQPIFGVSLEEIVTRPENNLHYNGTREIPLIVDDTVKYLRDKAMNVEGIFRLSGGNSQLKELRKSYDSGEEVDLNDVEDPHIVAGLLKLYLRELPVPLLVNCHSALLNCHDLPSEQEQIDYLKAIISALPKVHHATAKHLFTFWFDVAQNSAENRMTPVNLSIVTAPNVVRNPSETIESSLRDTPPINSVVALLIQHADKIL